MLAELSADVGREVACEIAVAETESVAARADSTRSLVSLRGESTSAIVKVGEA